MACMTKAEEKANLAKIINRLEDGYVRDILSGVQHEMESAIDSDFGFITLSARFQEIEEHRKEMAAAKIELAQLKTQIRELNEAKYRLENGINELRSTIRQFAKI